MEVMFDLNANFMDKYKGAQAEYLKYALAVAISGKLHMVVYGSSVSDYNTILRRTCELQPLLSSDEKNTLKRIYACANMPYDSDIRPLRTPHQTASLEGMLGGGVNIASGEVSLAHKGVLFLDNAPEYRTSVLQALRIPMEFQTIALSRAGRHVVYPADFQLIMSMQCCPCGNLTSKKGPCLCSGHSVELYWRKVSAPLFARCALRINGDEAKSSKAYTLETLRKMIARAWKAQYKRQGKLNGEISTYEVDNHIKFTDDCESLLGELGVKYTLWQFVEIKKLARTLQDMGQSSKCVTLSNLKKACKMYGTLPVEL